MHQLYGGFQMAKIFINTIVGAADNISQLDLVKHLDEMNLEIDGIEVRGELFSSLKKDRTAEFNAIRSIAKKHNWDVYISYPNDLFDITGIHEEARRAIQESEEHGILSVKMNTGNLLGIEKMNRTQYNELFQGEPLELRIENGQAIENGTIQSVQNAFNALVKQALPIGFTFDMGNWVIMDENPKKAFNDFKENITVFHLKNVNPAGETTLVDEGVVEWRELVHLDITYIIEYAIPLEDIQSEIDKVKQAMG